MTKQLTKRSKATYYKHRLDKAMAITEKEVVKVTVEAKENPSK